jgi:acetyl esterase/lipase
MRHTATMLILGLCAAIAPAIPADPPAIEALTPDSDPATEAEAAPAPPPIPPSGEAIPLWVEGAPAAKGRGEKHTPSITPHWPEPGTATGVSIVVCPGGGYGGLALDHEGDQIAAWLNAHGVAAFILRYRHAPDYQHPAPLMDARRALRTVRAHAAAWNLDPNRIGMMGFSAGGHLTATAGTQFEPGHPQAPDAVERESSRPDFLILGYPVITLADPYTHAGSRKNLLGSQPDEMLVEALSAENRVSSETPPTFLVHTTEDEAVPVQNSLLFYAALVRQGVPAELHVFERGRHGLGLAREDLGMSAWPAQCVTWLRLRGILP